jgi:predicted nuclease of predicted toxin-antitoxin system
MKQLLILADEGFNGHFVRALREQDFQVDWVLEVSPGIDDEEVIELAKGQGRTLLTEDKDFGEWVFAHQVSGLSIVFVRYSKEDYPIILESLITILTELNEKIDSQSNEFITINKNKIRRRLI